MDASMEWEEESGLVLMVPEAESVVRKLRYRFDPAAAAGVGAHITVLYPFVPPASLANGVDEGLIFSFPCYVAHGELKVVPNIEHNEFAQQKLQLTLEELRKEQGEISVKK